MTVKLVLDTRYKSKDHLFPIVIRIRCGNQLKQIPCEHRIPESAWENGAVKKKYRDASIINSDIANQLAAITTSIRKAQADNLTDMDAILGNTKKEETVQKASFSDYLHGRIMQFQSIHKLIHASRIDNMVKDMKACLKRDNVPFELSEEDVRTFYAYLMNIGNTGNTIQNKFKLLRQLYNSARKEGKTTEVNPFEGFKVNKKPVHKEKLTKEEIEALEHVVLPPGLLNNSRNLFLFSYYAKGMRFEDCIRVKHGDVIGDRIIFREIRKGHKRITVQLHSKLKQLIAPYLGNKTPYLFPFLKRELMLDKGLPLTMDSEKERIAKVSEQNVIVNRYLKIALLRAGIDKECTMHNSRHSFAYNMKKQGASISLIKDALGHSNVSQTETYLKALDDEAIDSEVNKLYL
jgi:integrase/recombinase XerD